jgi:mannosyltransferase
MTDRRATQVLLAMMILGGAVLRFADIGRLSLWYDEGYTAWAIDRPPAQIVSVIRGDTAPPLYYLLLHGWTLLFGRSEIGLRSMSAVLGVATISLVVAIARRALTNPSAIIVAAGLFALSYAQVWYSQEARAYELTAFWTGLMLWSLLSYLLRPSRKWLTLLIISVIGGAYTHNFMLLYIAAIGVAGLIFPSPMTMRQRVRDMGIVAGCLAMAYVPWLGALKGQIQRVDAGFWLPRPTLDSVCGVLARICGVEHRWSWDHVVYRLFRDTSIGVPRAAAAGLIGGIILAICYLRGDKRKMAIALSIAVLGAPLVAVVDSLLSRPILLPAAVLPSTVVFPILAAGALDWASRPWTRGLARAFLGFMVVLTAANLWAYEKERTKEDWRGAAAAVAAMPAVPSRLILFADRYSQYPFDYYYRLRPGESERPILLDQLDDLRRQIADGRLTDVVLVNSHAGWIDPSGGVHEAFTDPQALGTKMVFSIAALMQRIDLPNDPTKHEITIYRCVPYRD